MSGFFQGSKRMEIFKFDVAPLQYSRSVERLNPAESVNMYLDSVREGSRSHFKQKIRAHNTKKSIKSVFDLYVKHPFNATFTFANNATKKRNSYY